MVSCWKLSIIIIRTEYLFSPASCFKSSETFQLYIIRVQSKKTSWNVKRRFSEFFHLKQDLMRTDKIVSKYPFPAKVLIGSNFSLKLLETRKKCLHSFLQNILGNQQLCHKNEISTFLNNEVSINLLIYPIIYCMITLLQRDLPSYTESKYFQIEEKLSLSLEALRAENLKLKNKQETLVRLLR